MHLKMVDTMPKSLVHHLDYCMKEHKLMNYRDFAGETSDLITGIESFIHTCHVITLVYQYCYVICSLSVYKYMYIIFMFYGEI